MEEIIQHYVVDLSSNNNFIQIPTVEGDGNLIRKVEIELIENGVPYLPDKKTVTGSLMGTKPDTKQICNMINIEDNGWITFDITSQMSAVVGRGDYEIVLFDLKNNSQLKTFPFIIITTQAAFDVNTIISTDEFQLLTYTLSRALADYEYVIERANLAANKAVLAELNSKTSETKAENYATSAITAKDDALTYRNQAEGYKNEAFVSANLASEKASEILTTANLSKSYAVGGTGTRENEDIDNAKYYKEQVEAISTGLSGALLPMGTITFEQLKNQTKKVGYMFNISNEFTTTSDFKEGSGIVMPAGTNVYYTADNKWDCLAGTMVTGVKGGAESSYRRGNVNITRQNIGKYEVIQSTEPTGQNIGEFWMQEY